MENMENMENIETVETPVEKKPVDQAPVVETPVVEDPVAAAPVKNGKGMSIAALVCGLLGIVGGFIPVVTYFTFILAILGVIFGAKGQKIAKETGEGKGLATAGLVLGIIGVCLGALGLLCSLCTLCGLGALAGAAGIT